MDQMDYGAVLPPSLMVFFRSDYKYFSSCYGVLIITYSVSGKQYL